MFKLFLILEQRLQVSVVGHNKMDIEKINETEFRITGEGRVVNLIDLKQQLEITKQDNEKANELIEWKESLDEDKQDFVILLPIQETDELESLIKELETYGDNL